MPNKTKTNNKADVLSCLDALARNLWWSWHPDAQRLFASLDPRLWDATHHNPIKTIKLLTPERRAMLDQDASFMSHLDRVERALSDYMSARTWYQKGGRGSRRTVPLVAYFCFEFAIHESLPQYSGGLGVLAGDHVKSASDLGIPLVGIGLLYRRGFYTHQFAPDGSTQVIYPQIDFADCPVTDTGKIITVPIAGRTIKAKIYTQQVGRVRLILLNTDIPENTPTDRRLTDHLYGGDREYRIRQEILCGVGGMIALDAMGLKPTVYHLNEGHAAFAAIERVRRLVTSGKSRDAATKMVRKSTVFTTHTPVPAGNERFAPNLAWKYLKDSDLGLSREELMALGREEPANKSEDFCMTVLALRLAERCNGVAALHGDTSRKMWKKVYNTENPTKVPIGSVTNGIHTQTWLAPDMAELYEKRLKVDWNNPNTNGAIWSRIDRIPAQELWELRRHLRRRMIAFIRRRLADQALRHHATPAQMAAIDEMMDEHALTLGFARRFATYKRAPLIFNDPKRLARILSNEKRPVQLVFAGKAHPADIGGQKFAQTIYKYAQQPAFKNRVVILEDYDMELGRMLTSGCDVWLNNPVRPQEASGTSGMKPPLHGGINCSILDGWWPEAYNKKNGWEIGEGVELADPKKQDRHDASSIYKLLETEIVPEFYTRDRTGLPRRWIARMLESMKTVCPQFNTHRMVGEYWTHYYLPAHQNS